MCVCLILNTSFLPIIHKLKLLIPLVLEREFFINFALRNSVYVETNRFFLRVEHSHNAHNYVFKEWRLIVFF